MLKKQFRKILPAIEDRTIEQKTLIEVLTPYIRHNFDKSNCFISTLFVCIASFHPVYFKLHGTNGGPIELLIANLKQIII
eukprot:snap_masked-scaffold_38-processed-gene-2.63-mRNA-1 protein AED:1.00 eAED:1.00 QI:0/0/0/0/1/1/4/0/79